MINSRMLFFSSGIYAFIEVSWSSLLWHPNTDFPLKTKEDHIYSKLMFLILEVYVNIFCGKKQNVSYHISCL